MHRFFKILLAIIVFSCPIRCQLGLSNCCGEMVPSSQAECCCGDTGLETPVWPGDDSEEKCGCICSGATMPDATDLLIQTSVQFELELIPNPTTDALKDQWGFESRDRFSADLPACARNQGRQLRRLYSSFII